MSSVKTFLMVSCCLIVVSAIAQNSEEASVLKLSAEMFQWEVAGRMDAVAAVLDSKLLVVGSDGSTRNREQYIGRLSDGSFVHNDIGIEEAKAVVNGNTAVVAGKGKFTVTSGGNRNVLHLSYMEVFSRADDRSPWKLLAIKASGLANG